MHVSPINMIVAVASLLSLPPQQSEMLGHFASSHTVCTVPRVLTCTVWLICCASAWSLGIFNFNEALEFSTTDLTSRTVLSARKSIFAPRPCVCVCGRAPVCVYIGYALEKAFSTLLFFKKNKDLGSSFFYFDAIPLLYFYSFESFCPKNTCTVFTSTRRLSAYVFSFFFVCKKNIRKKQKCTIFCGGGGFLFIYLLLHVRR